MALKGSVRAVARQVKWRFRYGNTLRRIRRGLALNQAPSWVQIGIDDHCNYRCVMCRTHSYNLSSEGQLHRMPLDLFERTVAQLSSLGTKSIDICGAGEPLLHPNAVKMFRLIKHLGMECRLITNGTFLTRELCDELLSMELDLLRISINSATDETHHTVTEAPLGERREIMRNVGYLIRRRDETGARVPVVGATIAIHKLSYHEVAMLAQEAAELRLDNLEFLPLGINEASASLALTAEERAEARRQVEEADAIMRAHGRSTTASEYLSREDKEDWTKDLFRDLPCYIGQFFCRINANGDVNPCCPSVRVIGNVGQRGFRDVWASDDYRAFRLEALDLPNRDGPVEQCFCNNCYHFTQIFLYHRNLTGGHLDGLL